MADQQMNAQQFAAKVRAKFPGAYDGVNDDELTQRVLAKYPQYAPMVQSAPSGPRLPVPGGLQGPPAPPSPLAWLNPMDIPKGVGEGLLKTGTSLSPAINKIPIIGETLAPSQGIARANELATPANDTQAFFKNAEQAAEWLLPTGIEAKAGALAAAHAPQIAKFAVPAAKMTAAAMESGVRNKLQGGTFTGGAAGGAAGSVIGQSLFKPASTGLANIAMAPGKRMLKSLPEGVNIGETVLNNSTGIKPSTITSQLKEKLAGVASQQNDRLAEAAANGVTVPLYAARQAAAEELQNAVTKNSPDLIKDIAKVGDQLKYQYGPDGKPVMAAATPPTTQGAGFVPVQVSAPTKMNPVALPDYVDPVQARSLKQGMDNITFNPENQTDAARLRERVHGIVAGDIHAAVPGTEEADAAMTNLIPARDAAWNTSFNPGVTQSIAEKLARPTGALTGAVAGYNEGKKTGGTSGAILGGMLGLAGGNFLTSPVGEMLAARILASPNTINLAKGVGAQFARPSSLYTSTPSQ